MKTVDRSPELETGKDETLAVEVAYALPDRQRILRIEVNPGTTALEAVRQSAIEEEFPELTVDERSPLGIFGQAVPASQVLENGDRVEIYRPLLIDPKEVRRARAAKAKAGRAQETSG
ncbi:MAG: RnfH family protein [Chromatocurvus sp.]